MNSSLETFIISRNYLMKGVVYCAINKTNGKTYIGKTTNSLKRRQYEHKRASIKNQLNNYFHSSLNKYGFDNFDWGILFQSDDNQELCVKESEFIIKHKTADRDKGYNLKYLENNITVHTDATKKKISDKAKERLSVPEKNPFFKRRHTTETKKHLSEIRKGKKCGEEGSFYGKSHTNENKKHLSDSRKKWTNKPENKQTLKYQNQNRTLVYCIDENKMFDSIKDAADYFEINRNTFKVYIKKSEFVFGKRFITFKDY